MSKPEDILDQVLRGELTRQEAIELRPDMEDRLNLLTDLTDDLRSLPRYKPDTDFRNRARLRLLQHIQDTQQRRHWWESLVQPVQGLPGWASRVSAVVIASGGLTFGASYASASALPDDRLYPVKRAVEQVQVAMATSDEAKANTYLDLADRRAAEIAATAPDLDDSKLQGLTDDYGHALLKVSAAIQTLPDPAITLLDKVQARVASQATELEARAVNSASRPAVQQKLVQAEVVASNVVDRVALVAEKKGQPGPQDVHLAANPPAAATAAAASVPTPSPKPAAAAPAPSVSPSPSVAPQAPPNAPPASANTSLDPQFDRLWNEVAAAPFMGQRVRTQLQVDVANAKQDIHVGRTEAAIADMNAFVTQLQAAVTAHQATQYTTNRLTAEAKAIVAALQTPASGQLGLRKIPLP